MKPLHVLLAVIAAVCFVRPAQAQTVDMGAIDAYIEAEMERLRIPGLAIAVVSPDEVLYTQGYGVRNPQGEPVTPQTQFVLGSTSKAFTALAVMQLVEAGQVGLDDPVSRYIPEIEHPITVRQLLNQTSGLSERAGLLNAANKDQSETAIEAGALRSASSALVAQPDTQFIYSNANYEVLGLLIERVTGQPYEAAIEGGIFAPLGMGSSFARPDISVAYTTPPRLTEPATGYRHWFGQPRPAPGLLIPRAPLPAGFLFSTAEDMARWAQLHLNEGGDLLSAEAYATMTAPSAVGPYAMGWFAVESPGGTPLLLHGGDIPHFHSDVAVIPEAGLGVVVLMNVNGTTTPGVLSGVIDGVIALLLDEPEPAPAPAEPIMVLAAGLAVLVLAWMAFSGVLLRRTWPDRPLRNAALVRKLVLPLLVDALLVAALLIGVPAAFGAPLSTAVLFAPDVAVVLFALVGLTLTWGAARSALLLHDPNASSESQPHNTTIT